MPGYYSLLNFFNFFVLVFFFVFHPFICIAYAKVLLV
jgi:hypothetical protein